MLGANRVITVIHYADGAYYCDVIEGVSVYQRVEHTVGDKGVVAAVVATIRIPEAVLPERLPEAGDFVVFDRAESIAERQDIEMYGHTVIIGVGDNRRGNLPHIKLTCK